MWVLVLITFVGMTLVDVCGNLRTLLLAAQNNSLLLRIWKWEYRKHDLAYTLDGIADIIGSIATVGAGFSLLSVTQHGNNVILHFVFNGWTVLTLIGLFVGSIIGGIIGDAIAAKVVGVKVKEINAVINQRALGHRVLDKAA